VQVLLSAKLVVLVSFPSCYTIRNDMSAVLTKHLPSSDVPVNVPYQRHQPSYLCNEVITSVNRCNVQHYVIQGWTAGGRVRTVAGTCCNVCVNGSVVYTQNDCVMTARVEYDSSGQFCMFFWINTESFLTLLTGSRRPVRRLLRGAYEFCWWISMPHGR
jgi:hypothetical protein